MHRAAAADPYVREVELEDALVIRVGYGVGDDVADGHWERGARARAAQGARLAP